MSEENNIIDAEAEEIVESDNLPAVVAQIRASSSEPIELPNRQDSLLAGNPDRRCVATNSRGERCRKFAIYGATVCRTHGGATRKVKEAARVRVENASNRLMGKLIEFAFDDTKPPDVQLKAIQNSLDRAGLKPPSEVFLSQGEPKPYETVFDSIYSGPPGEFPSDASGYESAGGTRDVADVEIFPPTQPHPDTQAQPSHQAEPRDQGMADISAAEYVDASSEDDPPRQGRPHPRDREREPQPPSRHITGEAAMRAANWANAAMAESHGLPWGESARRRR